MTAMRGNHLGLVFSCVRLACPEIPLQILRHQQSITAAEKQALLPSSLHVQKSVSVEMGGLLVLLSGVGDFRLSRSHFQQIAAILGLSSQEAKNRRINPDWLDPVTTTGLVRGMVSPFFAPTSDPPFAAVVLMPSPDWLGAQGAQVAISIALNESLLVPVHLVPSLVKAYAWRAYPHIPVITLPALASSPAKKSLATPTSRTTTRVAITVKEVNMSGWIYLGIAGGLYTGFVALRALLIRWNARLRQRKRSQHPFWRKLALVAGPVVVGILYESLRQD